MMQHKKTKSIELNRQYYFAMALLFLWLLLFLAVQFKLIK